MSRLVARCSDLHSHLSSWLMLIGNRKMEVSNYLKTHVVSLTELQMALSTYVLACSKVFCLNLKRLVNRCK